MAKIKLEQVNKIYPNGVHAVYDFNLEIKDQEFLVLVGPSGCGKSTTLRMLAGLEEITSGSLYIDDVYVNNLSPKDRDIAMVFQSYALYPHMTVYENLAYGLKLRKYDRLTIDQKVREAAEILEITPYLDRKPKALSGGQRQRVALGRAIVREAKVFLLDEPLSNLDAKLRVHMRTELIKLHKQIAQKYNTTAVYVTHDQVEAMTMGHRIVVMRDGWIQQVADPATIYNHPENMFVAGFMGQPPMNFIYGVADEKGNFKINGETIQIPKGKLEILKANDFIGKEVVLGIRPEDIHDEEDEVVFEAYPNSVINVEVVLSELLGAETNIYFELNNASVIASLGAKDIRTGDKMKLALDMNKCHFFDPQSELVLKIED